MKRPTRHSIELPLGKVMLCAEAEVERLNPVKTRVVIDRVEVLYDGETIEDWNKRTKAGLSYTTLDGFKRVVEVLMQEKIEDEAIRQEEGR